MARLDGFTYWQSFSTVDMVTLRTSDSFSLGFSEYSPFNVSIFYCDREPLNTFWYTMVRALKSITETNPSFLDMSFS